MVKFNELSIIPKWFYLTITTIDWNLSL
jgi:hypothetical protein